MSLAITRTASLLYDSLLAVVFPQTCAVCTDLVAARADGIACGNCRARIKLFQEDDSLCWKCGAPSRGQISFEQKESVRCQRCSLDRFTAARACGVYEGALRASVLLLKREPFVSARLIRLLSDVFARAPLNAATIIVPVPLHGERIKARGFNQAAVLAQKLSRSAHLPLNDTSLVRILHTERHRAGMDAKGRRDTVVNAFQVLNPRVMEGERVLLIDDVFTTGATASACARALFEAGAAEVLVLTLARAL